ncbi:MAG: 3-oxoacyl-ACP synthase, partial [Deltaproteobacteria bacterium]|nr:3-oxoacyl-ACP synthase [Deltaproteobacteria bacterium]
MPNAYISGTGFYVPPRVVTNDELRTKYGIDTTDEWIRQRTGIEERHFADEGVGTADLAVPSAREAMARAGLANKDIDMIILATLSPDWGFPGSGVMLQQKLGFCDEGHFVPAMDIRNQCSGFLYSLATGTSFIRSGACKNILIVGSEVHSAAIDFSTAGRNVTSLFGDGSGAVVLSATEEDRGVRGWYLGADGRYV